MHSQGRGLSQDGGCEPQGKDKDENKDCGHQVAKGDAVAIAGRKLSHHERKLAQLPKSSGRKLHGPPAHGRKLAGPPKRGRKVAEVGFLNNDADSVASGFD